EAVDHDAACLSDAMRAVDRLGFGRRVPPRVEQEHIVGLGEREAEAAGLEADEEHGSAAGAEGLDDLRPVPRRPVEVLIGDALRVEFGGDGAQIAGELAEDERTMALGPDFAQVLEQHGQFARTDSRIGVFVDDARVEGEHPQQGERTEDREPVLLEVAEEAEHLLAFALEDRVVESAVLGFEFDAEHLFLLLRQVRGDEVLRASQHERTQPLAQLRHPFGIVARFDRSDVVVLKRFAFGNRPGAVTAASDHTSLSEFSIGVPVIANRKGAAIRRAARWVFAWLFFMNWASWKTTPAQSSPANSSTSSLITAQAVITTSDPAVASATVLPRFLAVADSAVTCRCGVNFRASSTQFATTEVGATTRKGDDSRLPSFRSRRSWSISASVCRVLPNPMSSARI